MSKQWESYHGDIKNKGTWLLIITLIRQYPYRTLLVFLSLLLAGILEAVGVASLLPLFSLMGGGVLTDNPINNLTSDIFSFLGIPLDVNNLLLGVLSLIILKAICSLNAMRLAGYAVANMGDEIRKSVIKVLMEVRWSYFKSIPLGRITNSIGTETARASRTYMILCKMLSEVVVVLAYLFVVFFNSWQTTVMAVFAGIVVFLALYKVIAFVKEAGHVQTKRMVSLSGMITDSVASIKAIKATGQEEFYQGLLEKESSLLRDAKKRQVFGKEFVIASRDPIIVCLITLGIFIAHNQMEVSLPILGTFAVMFMRIMQKMLNLQVMYQRLVVDESAYWSVNEILESAKDQEDIWSGEESPFFEESITFENVSFYHEDQTSRPALSEVSMVFPVHQFSAIVGPSGSGKTTLVDLILGFYPLQEGEILIDGISLSDVDIKDWRKKIGYVSQDCLLLHDTIYNNITMGNVYNEDEVMWVTKIAGVDQFAGDSVEGLHKVVGEKGQFFSGGQRQRIAIARSLINKPQLLILDEATSALDKNTESEILGNMKQLSKEVTIIAISHDQNIQDYADQTYVLTAGKMA